MLHKQVISMCILAAMLVLTGCSSAARENERILNNIKADPVMAAVMSESPGAEGMIRDAIAKSRDGEPSGRMKRLYELVMPIIHEHESVRLKYPSDRLLVNVAKLASNRAIELAYSNPQSCLLKQSELNSFTPEDKSYVKSMAILIARSTPDFNAKKAPKAEVEQVLMGLQQEVMRKSGWISGTNPGFGVALDHVTPTVRCRVMGEVLAAIAVLPPRRAGQILRGMGI